MTRRMQHSNPSMLLHIGMADACLVATEYCRDAETIRRTAAMQRYVKHPTHLQIPGCYSDDTEMSSANTKVLTTFDPPYTRLMFANAYVEEFAFCGRRKGYAQNFYRFLCTVHTGQEFLDRCEGKSDKNGGCMRAVPFGVFKTPKEAMHWAAFQASLTHDSPPGLFSARLTALLSHFSLYEDDGFEKFAVYAKRHLSAEEWETYGYIFSTPWRGQVKRRGDVPVSIATVHAAHYILSHANSLMEMLQMTIHFGGDTDSVAAIVWGVASARFQKEKLPEFLERDLEQGDPRTGAVYLKALGTKLMERFA